MTTDLKDSWAHEVGPHRVELIDIGEGFKGDFDPTDPADEPVLCLDHFRRDVNGQWQLIDEKFARTTLPIAASPEARVTALRSAMRRMLGAKAELPEDEPRATSTRSRSPSCSM